MTASDVQAAKQQTEASQDYLDGWADGQAGKDPDPERLAYGWNRMNDYERGYVAAGTSTATATERK